MNRKSIYWFGLGSGLIIGAMLVQLLSLGAEEPAMDLPAIEEAAARHGYRLVRDDESAWIVEEKIVRSFYIPEGMSDEAVADWLAASGLIDSREDFLAELALRPEPSILPGYYEFAEPVGLAELVEQLTTRSSEG